MRTHLALLISAVAPAFAVYAQSTAAPERLQPSQSVSVEPTSEFRSCYSESRKTWIVSVVADKRTPPKEVDRLIKDFVGTDFEESVRAKAAIASWQVGKFTDAESMAGAIFDACMSRLAAAKVDAGRSVNCFREHRIVFTALVMRDKQNLSQEEATHRLLLGSAGLIAESAVRRLAKETYGLSRVVDGTAHFEAKFQSCMATNKVAS